MKIFVVDLAADQDRCLGDCFELDHSRLGLGDCRSCLEGEDLVDGVMPEVEEGEPDLRSKS